MPSIIAWVFRPRIKNSVILSSLTIINGAIVHRLISTHHDPPQSPQDRVNLFPTSVREATPGDLVGPHFHECIIVRGVEEVPVSQATDPRPRPALAREVARLELLHPRICGEEISTVRHALGGEQRVIQGRVRPGRPYGIKKRVVALRKIAVAGERRQRIGVRQATTRAKPQHLLVSGGRDELRGQLLQVTAERRLYVRRAVQEGRGEMVDRPVRVHRTVLVVVVLCVEPVRRLRFTRPLAAYLKAELSRVQPQTPEESVGLREGGCGGGDSAQRVLCVLVGQRVVVLLVEELETQVLVGSLQVVVAQRRLRGVQRERLLLLRRPVALFVRLGSARLRLRHTLPLLRLRRRVVLRVRLLHVHRFAADHVGTALHHSVHTTAAFEENEAKPATVTLVMMVHYTRTFDLPKAGKVLPEVVYG